MKNVKAFSYWIVLLVLIFITRFYLLTIYSPNLTIDEVSIGYNAYTILDTGRDEWGKYLPTSFRSVGDFKPPVLVYVTVPFVAIFGLSELTTRLPVALFSALTIFLLFILLKKYLLKPKYINLAYLTTFLLTISPWHIVYSRSGFEAILALAFMLCNVILAFKYKKTGRISHFLLMAMFAYLAAITYHSAKLFAPVFNLLFISLNFHLLKINIRKWTENKVILFLVSMILILVTVFFVRFYIIGTGAHRAMMTFLAQDFDYARVLLPTLSSNPFSWFTSQFMLFTFWIKRYLEYFSPNFYLSTGLNITSAGHPGVGVIYFVELLFLIIGLIKVLFRRGVSEIFTSTIVPNLLVVWLLLGFFPASLANNSQHSLRSLNVVPVIYLLISLGIFSVFIYLKDNYSRVIPLFLLMLSFGYFMGIIRFVDFFTLHYPVELSEHRQQGWAEMAKYANEHHSEYDTVYVDHRFGIAGPYNYGVPHLYFLFYSAYDPHKYVFDTRRQIFNSDYENFRFVEINWPEIDHTKHNLYIASPWSFSDEILNSGKVKFNTKFTNGVTGLYAVSD